MRVIEILPPSGDLLYLRLHGRGGDRHRTVLRPLPQLPVLLFRVGLPLYTLEVFLCLGIIAIVIPVMIAYEIRRRYVMKVEEQLPALLGEIADMRDVGMTLQGAIFMISSSKMGVLSHEIKITAEELRLGSSVSDALVRMEERIGLVSVKRAISLLVRASEVTDYIREILTIAINDLNHYIKMKTKRMNVSFVYLAVIYLSFGIYLYSSYQLNVAFISSFEAFDVNFNISSNIQEMLHVGIIIGFFSGIMAGQLSNSTCWLQTCLCDAGRDGDPLCLRNMRRFHETR